MSSTASPAPIAIIGAGPCGLTLARLLERAGIEYIVFERDASAAPGRHNQGASLDLHAGTGLAAIEAMGLMPEFKKLARQAILTMQDSQGGNYMRVGTIPGEDAKKEDGAEKAEDFLAERPEIDRVQLRTLLLDSVPAHRVRWGKILRTIERRAGSEAPGAAGWVLRFADGSEETGFRLIVGADGAWSKVRPLITAAKPRYSGKMYIEGRIAQGNPQYAAAQEMVGPGNSIAIGAKRVLLMQQTSDLTYRVYAGVEEPEGLSRPGGALDFAGDVEKARAALFGLYAGWMPKLRALLEHADGPWRIWPLYTFVGADFPADKKNAGVDSTAWTRVAGVTLLGDAAHLGLPNGEGVNLAMLDALNLFQSLTAELGESGKGAFDDAADAAAIERAIVAYEAQMFPRARQHAEEGIFVNDMMYQADGAERMIGMFKQFSEAGQA
ncbi:monooxygenase [Nemania sp. FL0916]|nr:monooxygenase [Nemania sp. FL0916]